MHVEKVEKSLKTQRGTWGCTLNEGLWRQLELQILVRVVLSTSRTMHAVNNQIQRSLRAGSGSYSSLYGCIPWAGNGAASNIQIAALRCLLSPCKRRLCPLLSGRWKGVGIFRRYGIYKSISQILSFCDIAGIISWKFSQQGLERLAKGDLGRERLCVNVGLRREGKRKQWSYSCEWGRRAINWAKIQGVALLQTKKRIPFLIREPAAAEHKARNWRPVDVGSQQSTWPPAKSPPPMRVLSSPSLTPDSSKLSSSIRRVTWIGSFRTLEMSFIEGRGPNLLKMSEFHLLTFFVSRSPQSVWEHFCPSPKGAPYSLAVTPQSPLLQPWAITNLLSLCTDFPTGDMAGKRNDTVCDLLCLASLT